LINKISVLGCGWLGMPLAKYLAEKGFTVKGSTTSIDKIEEIKQNGIDPFTVILNPELRTKNFLEFLNSDLLIINIPPGRGEDKIQFHTYQINEIVNYVKQSAIKKIIYVSSTSVYGEDCGIVNEESLLDPITEGGKAVKAAEEILQNNFSANVTIVRFGGLIGEGRHPGRFLSYKNMFNDGNRPVNLIHQTDCINIIFEVIKNNLFGEIFNGVCSDHPTKKEFYTKAAESLNIDPPKFIDSDPRDFKIVDNTKVKEKLNYKFVYDSPLMMLKG
jgi:nucleoside-diphosphate-sugar epimerase